MLVSILIPCFNAEAWVDQAIESALAQTWPDKEVIVVNDGSTDGSLDVIRRYDGRIRWESGPNRGGGYARNRLLALARGEWLQYLDADDVLLPTKLDVQMAFAARHPDVDIICNPTVSETAVDGAPVRQEVPLPDCRDPWILLALWLLPQTGGPLWRREALEQAGGWKVGQPCCQEHELYERLLEAGCRFGFGEECLAVYRVWDLGDRLVTRLMDEVPRQRLLILDRMEDFLSANGDLTSVRRQAINDARHQLARDRWDGDPQEALRIVRRIRLSDRSYRPSPGPRSLRSYRLVYRALGFRAAQMAAAARRRLTGAGTIS